MFLANLPHKCRCISAYNFFNFHQKWQLEISAIISVANFSCDMLSIFDLATILYANVLILAQEHQSSTHDYGGAQRKDQTTFKHPVSSERTLLDTQVDQGIP